MNPTPQTRRGVLRATGASALSLFGGVCAGSVRGTAGGGYERKYEPVEDAKVDVGAVYIPFLGDMWGRCAKGQPAVGQYGMTDSTAVNRHVDQMQGFGISTVMFNFSVLDDAKYFERFVEAELTDDIPIDLFYNISNALKWRGDKTVKEQLDAHAEYIREQFLRRENVSTHYGRPTVSFWDVDYLTWGGNEQSADVKRGILDEWGNYEDFMTYLRSQLTVDGTDPYLIGDFHDNAIGGYSEEATELNRQFDAATNWTGLTNPGETVPWEDAFEHMRRNYEAIRSFTEEHDMNFAPMVLSGYDDRGNECWGGGKHVPRAPEHLASLLELADEYRTTDWINLATFNGWPEGHQVEPGRFDGTDYGTAYLEAIEEFQKTPPTTSTITTTTPPTTTTTSSPMTNTGSPSTTSTESSSTTSTESQATGTTTATPNAIEPTTETTVTDHRTTSRTAIADQTARSVPGFDITAATTGLAAGLAKYWRNQR